MINPTGTKKIMPVTEKQLKEFLIKELSITEYLYNKDMLLTEIKEMTEVKYLELLDKVSKHFRKPIEPPPLWKILFSPTRILNAMNRKGKMYGD
jgi:hypothetical protein